jgi:leader peptidase (prepilin peptidase)/N-methyltransferase
MLIGEEASSGEGTRPAFPDLLGAASPDGYAPFARPVRFAACVGLLAIVTLSLVPVEWRPSTGLAKELEHGIAYWIVAVVLTMAGLARWPGILAIVVLAAALEFGQNFVPGRDSNLADFLVSAAGALLGFGLCSLVLGLVSRDCTWRVPDDPAARSGPVRFKSIAAVVAVGLLAVGASMAAVDGTVGWLGAGLALAMLAIAVVDGQSFLIPDPLNAAGLALGLANSAVLGQGDLVAAMAGSALRAAVLALSFFGLRLIYARLRGRHGIGLGDVKLAAVAGIWLDWSVMPIAVEIAALSALSIYALRRYVLHHPLRSSSRLPFGLYFAPAIWIGWLLQTTLMQGW